MFNESSAKNRAVATATSDARPIWPHQRHQEKVSCGIMYVRFRGNLLREPSRLSLPEQGACYAPHVPMTIHNARRQRLMGLPNRSLSMRLLTLDVRAFRCLPPERTVATWQRLAACRPLSARLRVPRGSQPSRPFLRGERCPGLNTRRSWKLRPGRIEDRFATRLGTCCIRLILKIATRREEIRNVYQGDPEPFCCRLTLFGEWVRSVLRRLQTEGVAEQDAFCMSRHLVPSKVFVDVSLQLAELINIDRLLVLPFHLTDKAAFGVVKTASNSEPPSRKFVA